MSFPGGAQAENEPQSAGRQTGLVGMRHDGGIEQRSGFQRVFGQEIGADQQSSLFGYVLIRRQRLADLFEALQEELADVLVALGELSGDFVQQRADPVFRKRHDPGDDPGDPLGTTRIEGPQENAGLVGIENCGCAFEVHGHGCWRLLRDGDRFLESSSVCFAPVASPPTKAGRPGWIPLPGSR